MSSFEFPRAIVFGKYARTVITFNGDPELDGYATLEAFHFDGENYEFREFVFLNELPNAKREQYKDNPGYEVFDKEFSTHQVLVSEANPGKCRTCHAYADTRMHPIFQNYPVWPGAYGSEDDQIFRFGYSLGRFFQLQKKASDTEKEHYDSFRNSLNEMSHVRYRHLTPLKSASYTRPNLDFTKVLMSQALYGLATRFHRTPRASGELARFCSMTESDFEREQLQLRKDVFKLNLELVDRMLEFLSNSLSHQNVRVENHYNDFSDEDKEIAYLATWVPGRTGFELSAAESFDFIHYPAAACTHQFAKSINVRIEDYAINHLRVPVFTAGVSGNEYMVLRRYLQDMESPQLGLPIFH